MTVSCSTTVEQGSNPADAPQLAPAVKRVIARTVTADRGYGGKSVADDLRELGVRTVVVRTAFRRAVNVAAGA